MVMKEAMAGSASDKLIVDLGFRLVRPDEARVLRQVDPMQPSPFHPTFRDLCALPGATPSDIQATPTPQ